MGSAELEPWEEPLKYIGFRMERMDPLCVQGRFIVSAKSCQPFGVLHGGVSALIAEALASAGAVIASGYGRAAGIQLTINHLKPAPIGAEVSVSAKPVHTGNRLHVWDVTFVKIDKPLSKDLQAVSDEGVLIAVSRVTLMVNVSEEVLDTKYKNQKINSRL